MTRLAVCAQTVSKFIRKLSKKNDSSSLGELGRGAGKGGGGGGSIREAGGPFGKIGAGREEEYHYKLQRRLLAELKQKLHEENNLREKEITVHKKAIEENNELAKDIDEKLGDGSNPKRGK